MLKDKRRVRREIFTDETIKDGYAFHFGGRTELQYNIGFEGDLFRYGVAFSLELNQTLQTIEPLIPKIERFNEYLKLDIDELSTYQMWVWNRLERSVQTPPRPIRQCEIAAPHFIFFGKMFRLPRSIS